MDGPEDHRVPPGSPRKPEDAEGTLHDEPVGATQAALVLGSYLVGFLALAVALFKVRDVA